MKRFTKMLALGLAMALTFGMTVSAEGEETPEKNPSVHTSEAISTPAGMYQNETNQAERDAIADRAWDVVDGLLASAGVCKNADVWMLDQFDLHVDKPGNVTFWGYDWWSSKEYGSTWGVALVHFRGDLDGSPELIQMARTDEGKFVAHVQHGSPFAVILWHAEYATIVDRDIDWEEALDYYSPYLDDANEVSARLYNGLGNTIANTIGHSFNGVVQYGWYALRVSKTCNAYFDLPEIGSDEKYIMVSYPYAANGRANLNIDLPTYYVLQPENLSGSGRYYVAKGLNKGTQLVMIFKTKAGVESTGNPAPVVVGAAPAATAPTAEAPVTGGVVSPKTGEMLPIAVILAAICLAGAAVCAKKARTNA